MMSSEDTAERLLIEAVMVWAWLDKRKKGVNMMKMWDEMIYGSGAIRKSLLFLKSFSCFVVLAAPVINCNCALDVSWRKQMLLESRPTN